MDNKFFVSLEAARLLKEKGYDEIISTFYNEDGLLLEVVAYYNLVFLAIDELNDDHYPAITKSEAIDWLESKGIVVEIWRSNYSTGWGCSVEKNRILEYDSLIKDNILFPTRLEAEDAAIIKALELLKNKN